MIKRTVIFSWCVFCLLVTAVYAGNLVAMATKVRYSPPFTTFQELAVNRDYKVGSFEGSFMFEWLKASNDTTKRRLYDKVMRSSDVGRKTSESSLDYHMRKLNNTKYVFLDTSSMASSMKKRFCNLAVIREELISFTKGFTFPLKWPLRKLINKQLSFLVDNGNFAKMSQNWELSPKKCDVPVHKPQLKLDQLKLVLVTCSVGVALASVVLMAEILQKRRFC